jgi:hypothetical protein
MRFYRCKYCDFKIPVNKHKGIKSSKYIMGLHYDDKHKDLIPDDMSGFQYFYYLLTKKERGACVICKNPTDFNEVSMKYSRFCNNPKCKETYKKERDERMIRKYGKVHRLDEPEVQKEMQQNRSIAGTYQWSDGNTKISYLSSYELHFLKYLDLDLKWPAGDILGPSPNIYNYEYNGKSHYYMPDFFIPSLKMEIEIKSSVRMERQNPESRAKEKIKDELLKSCSDRVKYIMILDKNYEEFNKMIGAEVSEGGEESD